MQSNLLVLNRPQHRATSDSKEQGYLSVEARPYPYVFVRMFLSSIFRYSVDKHVSIYD
ncbi:MAG: hypothetical protein NMNS02_22540 [Nitrosomonas sp.]|nr:MAG: hypothetical protein NMNS02_22540 [Nitrosomonas sp.]